MAKAPPQHLYPGMTRYTTCRGVGGNLCRSGGCETSTRSLCIIWYDIYHDALLTEVQIGNTF
jgi:hypothetical protein